MIAIERAARAMYDAVAPDWDWDDPDAELLRRMYRANARAALATLRNISVTMRNQGEAYLANRADVSAESLWQAMLDAALNEAE